MTLQVSDVQNRVGFLLADVTNIRWTLNELIMWINDAAREISTMRPDASVKNISVQLAVGVKQTLPTDGIYLIDVIRNMGGDGATPGAAIRPTNIPALAAYNPNWSTDAASATVQNYMYSRRDPLHFYVYPQQPSSARGYVEMLYANEPAALNEGGANSQTLPLNDAFFPMTVSYVMFRCLSKDAEFAANAALANNYYSQFTMLLKAKTEAEQATSGDNG